MKLPQKELSTEPLQVLRLGSRRFKEVWDLQTNIQKRLIGAQGPETLIICEHFPVITAGKSANPKNLLVSVDTLRQSGIEYYEIERGGDMTYHGPGQLIAYPILDLRRRRQDVSWYMRSLEEIVIRTLDDFGLAGERIVGKTGVWMSSDCVSPKESPDRPRKIASLGVKLSHWCSMHGIALNVRSCESGFSHINPCGFHDIMVTSMEQESGRSISMEEVIDRFLTAFMEVFSESRVHDEN